MNGLWVAVVLVGATSSLTMLPMVVFNPFLHWQCKVFIASLHI